MNELDSAVPAALSPEHEAEKETTRVEAFSDGVFAIAITLLILEVKVPRELHAGGLAAALLHQWPTWIAYLSSFITIGIMWLNHHRLFTLIHRTDHRLLIYNGLLLLAISIVPFPTSVLAEYIGTSEGRAAATLYNGHGLLIAIAYTLLWRHAALGHRLLGRHVSQGAVRAIWRQYRFGPLFYVAGILIAQVSSYGALAFNAVLAIFFALPPRVQLEMR